MKAKLEELKKLMGYFEFVSVTYGDGGWILRNITDEGLGDGANRVKFTDSDPEVLVDRAISYAKNGPAQDILKAAAEITSLFNRRTLIQGDIISVITTDMEDLDVEERIVEMRWKYGRFDLEIFYAGIEESTDES